MNKRTRQLLQRLQPPPDPSPPHPAFRLGFWLSNAILLAALFALFSAGQLWGLFERAEFAAGDAFLNLRGPRPPTTPVVIVAIDDASLQASGYSWPWPRDYIAKVVEQIGAGKPSVLAIDIPFFEPSDREGADEALADALRQVNHVILAAKLSPTESLGEGLYVSRVAFPISILSDSADTAGLVNGLVDSDGIMRPLPKLFEQFDKPYYTLPVQVASYYLYQAPYDRTLAWQSLGIRDIATNFRGPAGTFPTISAISVANSEIPPETFAGKVVLLSVTDPTAHDVFPTPFGGFSQPMPGVEILANEIDTLIAGDYIHRIGVERGAASLPFLFVACLAGYIIGYSSRVLMSLPLLVTVGLVYVLAWGVAFHVLHIQLPLAVPMVGLVSGCTLSALKPKRPHFSTNASL